MRAARALVLALSISGCAATQNHDVSRLDASAERAYSAGRYVEAASRWQALAVRASRPRDRDEARYREAMSLVEAGRSTEAAAVLEQLIRESPHGSRAARAELDLARLRMASADSAGAQASLDALIRNHPESGVAVAALSARLDILAQEGEAAIRTYLATQLSTLETSELGEYLHAAYAASLERSHDLIGAKARYLFLADRYPYPKGVLWDDALFHAADLAARLGAPEEAIRHLERMLAAREPAYVQGSYERGRYGEAQYRIGELYRDAVHDPKRARAAFERLWSGHRTSRLRDDAAWSAALLARGSGDSQGACKDLQALVAELPLSRYSACVAHVCPALAPTKEAGPCHEYLSRKASE